MNLNPPSEDTYEDCYSTIDTACVSVDEAEQPVEPAASTAMVTNTINTGSEPSKTDKRFS